MSEKIGEIIGGLVIVGLIGFAIFGHDSSSPSSSYGRYEDYDDSSYVDNSEDMYDTAYDHWDEVREYISGTETIDACSDSGCYSLDADIYNGVIDTVYFSNGGYISPDAYIESDGSASGYDSDGRDWTFEVDTGSSLVEDAIQEWYDGYRESYDEYSDDREYYR